ncbi:MAG: hypothetical protein H6639_11030 [Caldilineaceae bacterium]|nr:hypothetical protein [Caldilineaceae bacterium]
MRTRHGYGWRYRFSANLVGEQLAGDAQSVEQRAQRFLPVAQEVVAHNLPHEFT